MSQLEYYEELTRLKFRQNKPHKCNLCSYTTNSPFFMVNHIRHHGLPSKPSSCDQKTPENYFCKDCQFSTNITTFFKLHIRCRHGGQNNQAYQYKSYTYLCRNCSFETNFVLRWMKHVINECLHHPERPKSPLDKLFLNPPEQSLPQSLPPSILDCDKCKFRARSTIGLSHHKNAKHEIPLECEFCRFQTHRINKLKSHVWAIHTSEIEKQTNVDIQWLHCGQCAYKTKYSEALIRHSVRHKKHQVFVHWDNKLIPWFHCDFCEYKTKAKRYLKKHMVHRHLKADEIDWFKCAQCDYKGKTSSSLKKHLNSKHSPEDTKRFQCDECEFKAKTNTLLMRHKKIHTRKWFECENCSYRTNKEGLYKRHVNKHV